MAAVVVPIKTPARPYVKVGHPACPVCEGFFAVGDLGEGCACGIVIHSECYWGRVATLAEWREYLELIFSPVENLEDHFPPIVCAQCRAGTGGA